MVNWQIIEEACGRLADFCCWWIVKLKHGPVYWLTDTGNGEWKATVKRFA